MKRIAWRAVKWLLGFAILILLLYVNWPKIQEMIAEGGRFKLWPMLVAALCFFAGLLLTFLRWFVLVRAQELPFTLLDAARLGFIGQFFNAFLPGSVGGDLVKAGLLAREQSRRTVAVSTIVVDRVIGLIGLLFLAGIAGLLFWNETGLVTDANGQKPLRWIVIFVWGVCAASLVGGGLMFLVLPWMHRLSDRLEHLPWVGRILAELLRAARMYRDKLPAVGGAFLLAMIGHVGFVLSFYFASLAVPPPVPVLYQQWLIVPVGMVAESVPLTPGNLGVGEFLFGKLYTLVGGDPMLEARGALARLAERTVAYAIALLGLVFYLPLRSTVRRMMVEAERDPNGNGEAVPAASLNPLPRGLDEAVP